MCSFFWYFFLTFVGMVRVACIGDGDMSHFRKSAGKSQDIPYIPYQDCIAKTTDDGKPGISVSEAFPREAWERKKKWRIFRKSPL